MRKEREKKILQFHLLRFLHNSSVFKAINFPTVTVFLLYGLQASYKVICSAFSNTSRISSLIIGLQHLRHHPALVDSSRHIQIHSHSIRGAGLLTLRLLFSYHPTCPSNLKGRLMKLLGVTYFNIYGISRLTVCSPRHRHN